MRKTIASPEFLRRMIKEYKRPTKKLSKSNRPQTRVFSYIPNQLKVTKTKLVKLQPNVQSIGKTESTETREEKNIFDVLAISPIPTLEEIDGDSTMDFYFGNGKHADPQTIYKAIYELPGKIGGPQRVKEIHPLPQKGSIPKVSILLKKRK